MFRHQMTRSDFEHMLNREWPGLAPIGDLRLKQSESGETIVLIFNTPSLTATEEGEVQDLDDSLYRLAVGGGRKLL